jgi:hypothetical protein
MSAVSELVEEARRRYLENNIPSVVVHLANFVRLFVSLLFKQVS